MIQQILPGGKTTLICEGTGLGEGAESPKGAEAQGCIETHPIGHMYCGKQMQSGGDFRDPGDQQMQQRIACEQCPQQGGKDGEEHDVTAKLH